MTSAEKKDKTPDSASAQEKTARIDDAVTKSVNAGSDAKSGTTSVLPGPPIPPEIQEQVRNERQTGGKAPSGRRGPPARKRDKENVND